MKIPTENMAMLLSEWPFKRNDSLLNRNWPGRHWTFSAALTVWMLLSVVAFGAGDVKGEFGFYQMKTNYLFFQSKIRLIVLASYLCCCCSWLGHICFFGRRCWCSSCCCCCSRCCFCCCCWISCCRSCCAAAVTCSCRCRRCHVWIRGQICHNGLVLGFVLVPDSIVGDDKVI